MSEILYFASILKKRKPRKARGKWGFIELNSITQAYMYHIKLFAPHAIIFYLIRKGKVIQSQVKGLFHDFAKRVDKLFGILYCVVNIRTAVWNLKRMYAYNQF